MQTGVIEPYYIKDRGIFIPIINKVLVMKDSFKGKAVTFDKAAAAPTKDEWYIILYFKDRINQLLIENGGEPLKPSWYWSSTAYDKRLAWYVYFNYGYTSHYYRYSFSYVRVVEPL